MNAEGWAVVVNIGGQEHFDYVEADRFAASSKPSFKVEKLLRLIGPTARIARVRLVEIKDEEAQG